MLLLLLLKHIINNEVAENITSPPLLTDNTIWKGDSIMAKQLISKTKRICQTKGCERKHYAKGLCKRCYRQTKYENGIHRTVRDPNEFIIEGNICRILLYDKYANYKHTAIIDAEDLNLVKNYKWMSAQTIYGHWYVRTSINRKIIPIHRMIMAHLLDDTKEIDHKNHNTFDNRKSNLRVCNRSQNMMNKKITKNNTSGFKGVSFCNHTQKWKASLSKQSKFIYLGLYKTALEAAKVYNKAALKYHGKFAYLNLI